MDEALFELITFLKDASPLVWETLLRQVQTEVYTGTFWGAVWLILSIVGMFSVRHASKKSREDAYSSWDEVARWSALASIITFVFSMALFTSAVKRALNPEFYAIKWFLEQIN